MVAKPVVAPVQRREQRAAAGQLGQAPVTVGAAGERVREIAVEHADHRRPQQHATLLRRRARGHLGDQVVADRAIVAREVGHEAARVRVAPQRQGGETERARPALRVLPQPPQVVGVQGQADGGQHLAGLGERHGERRLADLRQPVLHAQPRQAQGRIRAGRDHDPERRRGMVQQLIEVRVRGRAGVAEVVEHEHDRLRPVVERRRQRRHEALDPAVRLAGQRRHRVAGAGAAERLEDGVPERAPVRVGGVEGQPGHRAGRPAGADPAREQDGLAGPGRGGDERQRGLRAGVQRVEQPRPCDDRRLVGGHGEHRRRQPSRRSSRGKNGPLLIPGSVVGRGKLPDDRAWSCSFKHKQACQYSRPRTTHERPRGHRLSGPRHRAGRRLQRGPRAASPRARARGHGDRRAARRRQGEAAPAVHDRRRRRHGRAVGRPHRPDLLRPALRHGHRRRHRSRDAAR